MSNLFEKAKNEVIEARSESVPQKLSISVKSRMETKQGPRVFSISVEGDPAIWLEADEFAKHGLIPSAEEWLQQAIEPEIRRYLQLPGAARNLVKSKFGQSKPAAKRGRKPKSNLQK